MGFITTLLRGRGLIIGALAFALLIGWALRIDHLRAGWKARYNNLSEISGGILSEVRSASANPKLRLNDAAEQVAQISSAKREWQATSELQSSRIDALAIESARLKALKAPLRAKAEVAIAKRNGSVKRLETGMLDPGERADCAAQIFAANAALDLVYEEGL